MKKINIRKGLAVMISFGFGTSNLFAQTAGEIDQNWGNTGWIRADNINIGTELFFDMITLAEDAFLMVGYVNDNNGFDMLITKYSNDGNLDQSFGAGNGFVRIDLSIGGTDYAYSVEELVDGKLLITGRTLTFTGADLVLLKLEADGSFDNSFGTAGWTSYSFGDPTYAEPVHIEVLADSSIIVGGKYLKNSDSDVFLLKFTPSGNLDLSFGTNGALIFKEPFTLEEMTGLEVDDHGDIYFTVNRKLGINERAYLFKSENTGVLDLSFNTTGFVEYNEESKNFFNGMEIDDNGKIIVAGQQGLGDDFDGLILKYNADGTLDQSFGIQGSVILDAGVNDGILLNNIEVLQNGKMLVSGNASGASLQHIYANVFDQATGVTDCTFSSCDGLYLNYYFNPLNYKGNLLSLLADGSVLLGGYATSSDFSGIQTYVTKVFGVNQTAGLESNIFEKPTISVYPNPTTSDFNIEVNKSEDIKEVQLISYDGRKVQTWIGNSKEYLLNRTISTGNYLLKVLTNKTVYTNNLTIR